MSPTGTNDSGKNGLGASAETNAISRRHVLQIFGIAGVGAAGIGSVTACSPSKPNASGGDSGKSGNKEFHGAYPYQLPPKGHFNLIAGVTDGIQASNSPYFDLVYPSAGMYYWADKKWEWMMAESGTLDEATKTYTLKLRSGLKWSDDKPVTAKDVVSTFNLRWLLRQQEWTFLSDVSAKDDTTVVFTIGTPSTVLERYILRAGILPDSVYGEWATQAETMRKAKTSLDSAEGKKLNGDFQKFRPENPVVSGPFNFDVKSMTNAQMSLVKNDKGLFADKIGFTKVVLYNGETSDISPVVLNKDVDYATHGFAVATEKTLLGSGFRILRPPVYSGPALVFNYTAHPELADARVRQAIAYVLDRNENGTVALGDSGKPCKFMAGFSDILVPDWVSDADQKKLQAYEKDEAKATSLLTEAGWKKTGGKWTLPNGKPAAYDVKFPTEFADWNPGCHQRGRPAEQVRVQHHQAGYHLHPAEPGRPGRQVRHRHPGLGRVEPPAPVLRVRPGPVHVQLRDRGELRRQGHELPAQADHLGGSDRPAVRGGQVRAGPERRRAEEEHHRRGDGVQRTAADHPALGALR